jgi:hypothetical protein
MRQPNLACIALSTMPNWSLTRVDAQAYVPPVNPRCSFGEAVLGQRESAGPCFYAGRCA